VHGHHFGVKALKVQSEWEWKGREYDTESVLIFGVEMIWTESLNERI